MPHILLHRNDRSRGKQATVTILGLALISAFVTTIDIKNINLQI